RVGRPPRVVRVASRLPDRGPVQRPAHRGRQPPGRALRVAEPPGPQLRRTRPARARRVRHHPPRRPGQGPRRIPAVAPRPRPRRPALGEVTPGEGLTRPLEKGGCRRLQAAWLRAIFVSGRLIGVAPFPAGRVPALEPDLREPTLLLEHGLRHLPGFFGRLHRPRVQVKMRLIRGDRDVIAQAIAQKIAIMRSLYRAPAVIDDQTYPPFFGHGEIV